MSTAPFFILSCAFTCFRLSFSTTLEYDGQSHVVVQNDAPHQWALKYSLGSLCTASSWVKTLVVDVKATSCEDCACPEGTWGEKDCQADLIMALGTDEQYFTLAVAYDGGMNIALDEDGIKRKAAGFIAPMSGLPLFAADNDDETLENMYYEDGAGTTWRSSLIPGDEGHAYEKWQNLTRDGEDASVKYHAFSENESPLRIRIASSRHMDQTRVTVTKNGHSETVILTSTWDGGEHEAYFYMATDYYNDDESFDLTGITSTDECTPTTTPAPTCDANTDCRGVFGNGERVVCCDHECYEGSVCPGEESCTRGYNPYCCNDVTYNNPCLAVDAGFDDYEDVCENGRCTSRSVINVPAANVPANDMTFVVNVPAATLLMWVVGLVPSAMMCCIVVLLAMGGCKWQSKSAYASVKDIELDPLDPLN